MAPAAKQNSKPVFKTLSPFTETKWPEMTNDDQEVITELLCNLLTPLGDHRGNYTHPSKSKKRKRNTKTTQDDSTLSEPAPPLPEIGKHLLVGINSVTRHLEASAACNAPSTSTALIATARNAPIEVSKQTPEDPQEANGQEKQDGKTHSKPLSMVILTHPKPSLSPAHAHLPTLLHLSTLSPSSSPTTTSTRLIALPTSTDALLASALHIPRVGALAIYEGAPGARALEDYVREHVGVTECAWIDEAMKAEWRGLNVKSEIPEAKAKVKA